MEKFKVSDEYLDKLCNYYVEGFELFQKYLAKHPSLDFSKLDMEAVEKEILVDRQSTEGVGEGGDVIAPDEAISVDCRLLLYLRTLLFFFFFEQSLGLVCFEQTYILLLKSILRCFLSVFIFHCFLSSIFNFVCFISSLSFVLTVTYQ